MQSIIMQIEKYHFKMKKVNQYTELYNQSTACFYFGITYHCCIIIWKKKPVIPLWNLFVYSLIWSDLRNYKYKKQKGAFFLYFNFLSFPCIHGHSNNLSPHPVTNFIRWILYSQSDHEVRRLSWILSYQCNLFWWRTPLETSVFRYQKSRQFTKY